MILNNKIIELLKQKSGLHFDKTIDFELLSSDIYKVTGRSIGVTTLKRLFNYINDDRRAVGFTLNTIAQYLGFKEWNMLIKEVNLDSIWNYEDDTVYVQALEEGTVIDVAYLDRNVKFVVVKRNEQNCLKVLMSKKSSLHIGDLCDIHFIRKGFPLEAEHVYRGDKIGNYKTRSEVTSVTVMQQQSEE